MRKLLVVAVLVAALVSSGCINIAFGAKVHGSGVEATETRDMPAFSRINLRGSPDVHVTIGDPASVTVTADDNLMEIIETEVDGSTLVISTRESYSSKVGVRVAIVTPVLEAASVTGAGDLKVDGAVDAGSFEASVTGSGDLIVRDLTADSVEASVTGSGDVKMRGAANRVEASVKGSGDVDISGLVAAHGTASIMGSGDIRLHAEESLSATIYGSGDIVCGGNPGDVRQTVKGSGDVRIARR